MSKLSRVTQKIFGSTSGSNQIAQFGSLSAGSPEFTTSPATVQALSQYDVGWFGAVVSGNSPAIEDMNAIHFLYAYQLAYIMQAGVPEYDAATVYYTGSFVNSGGSLYVSQIDNNVGNAVSGSDWAIYGAGGGGGAAWGSITGTLSSQTDLQTALNLLAPIANPTFTGLLTAPNGTLSGGGDSQRSIPGLAFELNANSGISYSTDGTQDSLMVGMAQRDMMRFNVVLGNPDSRTIAVLAPSGFYPDDTYNFQIPLGLAAAYWGPVWALTYNGGNPNVNTHYPYMQAPNTQLHLGMDNSYPPVAGTTSGMKVYFSAFTPSASAVGPAGFFAYETSGSVNRSVIRGATTEDASVVFALAAIPLVLELRGGDCLDSSQAVGGAEVWLHGGSTVSSSQNGANAVLLGGAAGSGGVAGLVEVRSSGFVASYDYATPTTGGTVTLARDVMEHIIDPSGSLATLTITLPASPHDGQVVEVVCSEAVTSLTLSGSGSDTVKNTLTSLTAGQRFKRQYRLTNTTWY